jgi:hypothetical protein
MIGRASPSLSETEAIIKTAWHLLPSRGVVARKKVVAICARIRGPRRYQQEHRFIWPETWDRKFLFRN